MGKGSGSSAAWLVVGRKKAISKAVIESVRFMASSSV
jgi:hypothetical protein